MNEILKRIKCWLYRSEAPTPTDSHNTRCLACKLYRAYQKDEGISPENCINYLCNDGDCPHDEEIGKLTLRKPKE